MQSGLYFEFYVKDGKLKSRLKISMYVYQLLSWLLIVSTSKIILAFIQLGFSTALQIIGSAILKPFKDTPKLKLLVVMIFVPIIMNSIQFWVQDNFLKHKKEVYPQLEVPQSKQMQYILPDPSNDYLDGSGGDKKEMQIDFENKDPKPDIIINQINVALKQKK